MATKKSAKRVLLINPWIYDFAAFDFWLKPLGILYLLSFLKRNEIETYFIDCLDRHDNDLSLLGGIGLIKDKNYGCGNFHKEKIEKPDILKDVPRNYYRYGLPLKIVEEKISKIPVPDYVLITSMMTYWYPAIKDIIKIVREFFPKTKVILGGIYASLCPNHALEECKADIVYRGKGLKKILAIIRGEYFPSVIENDSDFNFEELPYPDYGHYSSLDYFCILTSFGCPFRCTYCASHILYSDFYQRRVDDVIEEILYQINRGDYKNLAFYDDALLVNANKHFEKILDELIKRKISLYLHSPNGLHPKFIDYSLAIKMKMAGFKTIRIALETINPKRQYDTGGKVWNEDYVKAMDALQRAGFSEEEIGTYLFFGFPGQDLEEVVEGIKFIKDQGSQVNLVEYSPIPGTKMWMELIDKEIIPNNLDPLLQNNSVFFRKYSGISEDELQYLKSLIH
ncbi:MAG: radical SAM protein [Candidatus Schekmanbacteria bacterium]|nr:MAG: radical SAM protein [Candidatus Schekmanbacteria bacterium]